MENKRRSPHHKTWRGKAPFKNKEAPSAKKTQTHRRRQTERPMGLPVPSRWGNSPTGTSRVGRGGRIQSLTANNRYAVSSKTHTRTPHLKCMQTHPYRTQHMKYDDIMTTACQTLWDCHYIYNTDIYILYLTMYLLYIYDIYIIYYTSYYTY